MIRSGMLGCCEMQTCSVKRLPYYARVYYRWHVCMHISHTRPCNINAKDENFLPTAKVLCRGDMANHDYDAGRDWIPGHDELRAVVRSVGCVDCCGDTGRSKTTIAPAASCRGQGRRAIPAPMDHRRRQHFQPQHLDCSYGADFIVEAPGTHRRTVLSSMYRFTSCGSM